MYVRFFTILFITVAHTACGALVAQPTYAQSDTPLPMTEGAKKESPPVVINAAVDKAVASSSEAITLTVTISLAPAYRDLQIPEYGSKISGFRVVDFGAKDPEVEGERTIRSYWYKLRADVSGSYVLPSMEVPYETPNGDKSSAATSEIFVEIKAAETPATGDKESGDRQEQDIRDIKPLIPAERHYLLLITIAVGILLVIGLGVALAMLWSRRRSKQGIAPLAPHELALRDLKKLEGTDFLAAGKAKEFHFTLSEVIRQYLEGQYGLPATDRTSEEIRDEIGGLDSIADKLREDYMEILRNTDMVKFTDHDPGADISLKVLSEAQRFVEETKPVEEGSDEESVI